MAAMEAVPTVFMSADQVPSLIDVRVKKGLTPQKRMVQTFADRTGRLVVCWTGSSSCLLGGGLRRSWDRDGRFGL